ncbi:MAG TPA: hypothetical protein VGC30_06635 [Dokdonella sp.]
MQSHDPRDRRALFALAVLCCAATAPAAHAEDYPVSGTISVGGQSGALPDGGVFAGASYDPASGAIGAGAFVFPQTTASFDSDLGTVVVTYRLSQAGASGGQVGADGSAALATASMRLDVLHVTISGFPIAVGNCTFAPVELDLAGSASADALDLADDGFTIPPVAPDDCGGFGGEIDDVIAGGDNAIALAIAGNFTPPAADDAIFADGFDA